MLNAFVHTTVTVQFPTAPKAGAGTGRVRYQPRDFTLGGEFYMYDRGVRKLTHDLVFDRVPQSALDQLEVLADTLARGATYGFAWYDQAGAVHTVRMPNGYRVSEPWPGRYRVTITLEENS